VRDQDREKLERFLLHVSAKDRRFRFLGDAPSTHGARLAAMIDVDHEATEHFVGFLPHSGMIIASALLTGERENGRAGVAILIDRHHKVKGYGWALLADVARFARSHGFKRLISIEAGQTRAALAVEEDMGFKITPMPAERISCSSKPNYSIAIANIRRLATPRSGPQPRRAARAAPF